jgi:hypothetical protein
MINLLLNTKKPGKINFFEFDVTINESHEMTNMITDFPVEEGYSISDHVLRIPERSTLQGFITNSPIPRSRGTLLNLFDKSNRVNAALESILQIAGFDSAGKITSEVSKFKRVPQVITVVTGLRSYANMVITNVVIPRDKDTGDALIFTIEMRRLIVAFSETAIVQNISDLNGKAPRAPTMGSKTLNKSVQTPTNASADQGTFLLKLSKKLKGL